MHNQLTTLLGLGLICAVGIGVVLLMLRLDPQTSQPPVVFGYPPDRYPAQHLARSAPLAALVAVQSRLLAVYAQLPLQSEGRVWLGAFLAELRQIMDSAYRAAGIAQVYGTTPELDRLVAEVQAVERELASSLLTRTLRGDGEIDEQSLNAHLAVLRRYVYELAG